LTRRLRTDARLLPLLAAAVVLFGVLAHANATLLQAGTYAAIYAVAAIGLSILLGNVAQISIGQAGFFGIGAYAVGYLTTAVTWPPGVPLWLQFVLATALGTALAGLFGLVLGFIALRFHGHYLAMATLAFGLIVVGVVRASGALGGASGIQNIPFAQFGPLPISGAAAFWYGWGMVALVALLSTNLLNGRTGRAFEAIRNDELAAEVLGVPTRRTKILAFAYAGALAGFAGTFFASYLGLVDPGTVGISLSIDLLLMVVLGGAGGVSGAIAGATLIGIANIYGHNLENWRPVIYGVLVIGIVIFFPRGLVGLVRFPSPRAAHHEATPDSEIASNASASDANASGARDSLARASDATDSSAGDARAKGSITSITEIERANDSGAGSNTGVTRPWLVVEGATKRFGGLVAVDDVSFALENGRVTALIGPNGAGKTTLFNAICGVGRLDAGRVLVAGSEVTAWQAHRIAALGVGRSFQNARLFAEMTVLENVVVGAFVTERATFVDDLLRRAASRHSGRDAAERARAVLADLRLEHLSAVLARDLAFGDRRRVELARALAAQPGLLLVDEPAAGLNARERARLREDLHALRERGLTLLLIEHDMRLVMDVSDRVMVLRLGRKIADGPPALVRNDAEVISAYLGTSA
jgi:branched-chain amino acid transport system permease protein